MTTPAGGDDHQLRNSWAATAATSSLWDRQDRPSYERHVSDRRVDVAVIGGGIAGVTTAVLLADAGCSVALLEGRRIGDGTTGRSTAKVSALQGARYRSITGMHGVDAARAYAADQLEALSWIEQQVSSRSIDCAWERRPAISYATSDDGARTIQEEAAAASAAGLPVVVDAEVELPFPVTAAVSLGDQGQFSPVPYIEALAAAVDDTPGCSVHEDSRVLGVTGRGTQRVRTRHGTVHADHVVVTTLLPFLDRGLFFARARPSMSYAVALDVAGDLPRGMYLSVDEPTRSLRTARQGDRELLLVGGEGSKVGSGPLPSEAVDRLVSWAREHFEVLDVVTAWSAHDYVPADHLPWVGPTSPFTPRVLIATGFEKWGMTMGTVAAHRLTRHILGGGPEPWAPYDPARLSVRSLPGAARLNAEVATRLIGDWARPESPAAPDGTGRRFRAGVVPKGDPDGRDDTEAMSVVCTHLGGICRWNDLDRTWDCPLHGSRFEADGTVVSGPAVRPLRGGHDPTSPTV